MPIEQRATDFEKLPPHDTDAEMSAVGSMMLCGTDLATFEATRRLLRAEYFYLADLGVYFDAICRVKAAGSPIDTRIVRAELERAGLLAETGGIEFMAKVLESVPSHAHGPHYAAIVREKYVLREVVRVAGSAIRRVYAAADHDRSADIAQQFVRDLSSLAYTGVADKIHTLESAVMEVLEQQETGTATRIPTGLKDLDRKIVGGLPRGKFTQVGGRPSMGKSMFCKQVALNAANAGHRCGIVTVEEDRMKVAQNYLANASGIANNKIAGQNMCREEWHEVTGAVSRLPLKTLFIADSPVTLSEVEGSICAMVAEHQCDLVVVDYLQLIDPEVRGDNENREITKISKSLKAAFKRMNVAGLVACQLNRGNETGGIRRPTLKDLRGSGSLEQDGDLIILLHREDYYRKGQQGYQPTHQIEAIVAKNKDGGTGRVPLYFSGASQSVSDWTLPMPTNEESND